uniref:Uncharacterized protein n=1 Tax=Candidatus Kentrum sp. FW TaxID=2126338 RepID=A0A450TM30_9GAMM|nr:MAG: hypothetical protein BECKFW1821B_GA0114236_11524 [Candidatus Kentron sp. FW]
MIETKFSFFQAQVEGVFMYALELGKTMFSVCPEGLDAIDSLDSPGCSPRRQTKKGLRSSTNPNK